MKASEEAILLSLLNQALESSDGIEVQLLSSNEVHFVRTQLYKLRKAHRPQFDALSFLDEGANLWIRRHARDTDYRTDEAYAPPEEG